MPDEHDHRVAPEQVEDMLEAEFDDSVPQHERVEAAHEFDRARISSFVPILAWRRARDRIRSYLGRTNVAPAGIEPATRGLGNRRPGLTCASAPPVRRQPHRVRPHGMVVRALTVSR